eukprot:7390144-Prymnesium_polylepis.1
MAFPTPRHPDLSVGVSTPSFPNTPPECRDSLQHDPTGMILKARRSPEDHDEALTIACPV